MLKGGYQIINLDGYNISLGNSIKIPNLDKILKSSNKVILISGLTINGNTERDFYVAETEEQMFSNGVYDISIVNDNITVKRASKSVLETETIDLSVVVPEVNFVFTITGIYDKIRKFVNNGGILYVINEPFNGALSNGRIFASAHETSKEFINDETGPYIVDGYNLNNNYFITEDDKIRDWRGDY